MTLLITLPIKNEDGSFDSEYSVGTDGNVYSLKFNKVRKMKQGGTTYGLVNISKNGKQISKAVHKMVCRTFHPNPENKPCVDHINRNIRDNRPENLRWVCYRENNQNKSNQSKHGHNIFYDERCTKRPWKVTIRIKGVLRTKYLKTKEKALLFREKVLAVLKKHSM